MCTRRKLVNHHHRCSPRDKKSRGQQCKIEKVSADEVNSLKTACIDQSRQRPPTRPSKMRHKAGTQKRLGRKRRIKRSAKYKSTIKTAPSIPFTARFGADGRCVPCSGALDKESKFNWRPLGHALRAACTLVRGLGVAGSSGTYRCQRKSSSQQPRAAFLSQQEGEPKARPNMCNRPQNWMPTAYGATMNKGGAVFTELCSRNELICAQAAPNGNRGFDEVCNPCIGLLYAHEEKFKSYPCAQTLWSTVNHRGDHREQSLSPTLREKLTAAKENQEFACLINQLSNHYTYVNEGDAIKEYEMQNRMLQGLKSSTMYQQPYDLENPSTWMSVLPTNVVSKYLRR